MVPSASKIRADLQQLAQDSFDAPVSKENLASTSVETRPGTIFKISFPNSTSRASRAFSDCSSMELATMSRVSLLSQN